MLAAEALLEARNARPFLLVDAVPIVPGIAGVAGILDELPMQRVRRHQVARLRRGSAMHIGDGISEISHKAAGQELVPLPDRRQFDRAALDHRFVIVPVMQAELVAGRSLFQ